MARLPCLSVAIGLVLASALLGAGGASAGAPPVRTATPTSTPAEASPTATPSPADLVLRFDKATFTWRSVPGAASYHLIGSLFLVRINAADPFCTPPLARQSMTLPIDETLPAAATSFPLPLPALPAVDAWFVVDEQANIRALDASGVVVGVAGGVGVAETTGGCPIRDIGLPATGAAAPPSSAPGTASWVLVAAAVFGLLGATACLLARCARG